MHEQFLLALPQCVVIVLRDGRGSVFVYKMMARVTVIVGSTHGGWDIYWGPYMKCSRPGGSSDRRGGKSRAKGST